MTVVTPGVEVSIPTWPLIICAPSGFAYKVSGDRAAKTAKFTIWRTESQVPNTVLKFSRPWAVFGFTRCIVFTTFVFPGFKSCVSISSTSAKVYAPPLQLQFPPPRRNDAHECRCELILEMQGLAVLKNAWSFDILLAFWESS